MKFNRSTCRLFVPAAALAIVGCALQRANAALPAVPASGEFSFTTAGDMRSYTENTKPDGKRFFDCACEEMKRVGPGAFLISPGDFDPPAANRAIIDRYLGKNFMWYIVVGNHEVENAT